MSIPGRKETEHMMGRYKISDFERKGDKSVKMG